MGISLEEKEKRKLKRKQNKWNQTHKIINGIDYKKCNICEKYYISNSNYFYNNSSNGIDGLSPNCISCDREKANKNRIENIKRHRSQNLKRYYRMKDKWNEHCKEYRKKNPEKWYNYHKSMMSSQEGKEKVKAYKKKHSIKDHVMSKSEWENCKNYFNYKCAYCEIPIEDHKIRRNNKIIDSDFHKEHVIHNGKNDLSNCIPACCSCNTQKHKKTLNQWYNQNNSKYKRERYLKIYKWIRYDYKKYIEQKNPKTKYINSVSKFDNTKNINKINKKI